MNEKLITAKNHVLRNRAKYAVAATVTVCVAVQYKAASQWNEFLKENDLFEKFYQEQD
ncbi:hypothetical protein SEA_RICKMORE_37 [Gordonia phage Rickmore]|uniref:Uncharacterized protein n=1 Tax=Gordonia phage Rickmore TaxID=2507854 RepID=A0A410TB71_9CAUD|nr:hypothetical protein HWC05_gp37 [Gordonia phage Rickmore]QAU06271.1 hypothetical protein SEA_RICKMORE_37 [Gordonia phage Rickmore]